MTIGVGLASGHGFNREHALTILTSNRELSSSGITKEALASETSGGSWKSRRGNLGGQQANTIGNWYAIGQIPCLLRVRASPARLPRRPISSPLTGEKMPSNRL